MQTLLISLVISFVVGVFGGWNVKAHFAHAAENAAVTKAMQAQAQQFDEALKERSATINRLQSASATYQKRNAENEANNVEYRKLLTRGVRIPPSGGNAAQTGASASASGHYGGETIQLSGEAATAIFNLAAEADRNTDQLTACQNALKPK